MRKIVTVLGALLITFLCNFHANAEEIVLNFDKFTTGPKYYSSGDWYVVLENEEDWEVYLNWFAPKNNYCGTFQTKDFDHDYSYIFTPDNRENGAIHYESITMNINIEEVTPLLSRIVLTATITGDDGNTYKVAAQQDILNVKTTIESSIMDASFISGDGEYTIMGKNEDLDFHMVVQSNQITGIFNSIAYFDIDNSHVIYKGDSIQPMQIEAIVDLGLIENDVLAYGAQFNIISTDTVLYKISVAAPFPSPTDTIDIQCHNLHIEDTWASMYNTITMTAHNDDYEVMIMYADHLLQAKEYTEAETVVHITDRHSLTTVEALVTRMQISQTSNGDYQAVLESRCTDNKIYTMHLSWIVPTPQDTLAIDFDYSAKASYYSTNNDLLLINQDDTYELSLNVYGIALGEHFTLDNMGSYTHLYVHSAEVEIADVQGQIYQSHDTTWIQAEIIGFDAVLYQTTLWYVAPVPSETINISLTEVPFDNHLEEGYFHFLSYSADSLYAISLMPATHQVEGSYVNDGVFGKFGEGQYDFFNDYTYVGEWNETTQSYDIYTVEKGEMHVQMDADGTIHATASVVCENAKQYNITITSHYERKHLDWDAEDTPVERTYTTVDQMEIADFTNEGYMVFSVDAQDQSDMVVLYLFTDTPDKEIGLPVGTYSINNTHVAGSVLASTGVNDDGSVSPSIYSTTDGEYLDRMYFLVDGTVTVSKNKDNTLRLEVNAVNSYDIPVHIVYDGTATGLEDIQVETINGTTKVMTNGQLVIIRDGKIYNAMGTLMN